MADVCCVIELNVDFVGSHIQLSSTFSPSYLQSCEPFWFLQVTLQPRLGWAGAAASPRDWWGCCRILDASQERKRFAEDEMRSKKRKRMKKSLWKCRAMQLAACMPMMLSHCEGVDVEKPRPFFGKREHLFWSIDELKTNTYIHLYKHCCQWVY